MQGNGTGIVIMCYYTGLARVKLSFSLDIVVVDEKKSGFNRFV